MIPPRVEGQKSTGPVALIGGMVVCLAVALYAGRMATSFTFGDTADYLNSAHTGALAERGNGLPLYVTLLNLALHFPLPFGVTDGIRCNLLSVLTGAGAALLTYLVAWRWTRNLAAAMLAALAFTLSGLIWFNAVWIMPHIWMGLTAAAFLYALQRYDLRSGSWAAFALGLVPSLGSGLMPTAFLFVPAAFIAPLLIRGHRGCWTHVGSVAMGFLTGLMVNGLLIAVHEWLRPIHWEPGTSMFATVVYFLRGGAETGWFLENLSLGAATTGMLRLPLRIAADFELIGTLCALVGLVVGLRSRPRVHLTLLATFVAFGIWVGVYPGDTRMLHGIGSYPIAASWLAVGGDWILRRVPAAQASVSRERRGPLAPVALGLVSCSLLLGNILVGNLTYHRALCDRSQPLASVFCAERVPDRFGDRFLQRATDALDVVPEGALVMGMMWDATDQLNHLIEIRGARQDLQPARDLTKLSVPEFEALVEPYWTEEKPVFLYGEWADVPTYMPEFLDVFEAQQRGPHVFRLFPADGDSTDRDPVGTTRGPSSDANSIEAGREGG